MPESKGNDRFRRNKLGTRNEGIRTGGRKEGPVAFGALQVISYAADPWRDPSGWTMAGLSVGVDGQADGWRPVEGESRWVDGTSGAIGDTSGWWEKIPTITTPAAGEAKGRKA